MGDSQSSWRCTFVSFKNRKFHWWIVKYSAPFNHKRMTRVLNCVWEIALLVLREERCYVVQNSMQNNWKKREEEKNCLQKRLDWRKTTCTCTQSSSGCLRVCFKCLQSAFSFLFSTKYVQKAFMAATDTHECECEAIYGLNNVAHTRHPSVAFGARFYFIFLHLQEILRSCGMQ